MTKVRIGIQTGQEEIEWSHLVDFWRFLDKETKFDSVWTMDHFVPPGPGANITGPCMEGWSTLTAGAQATERLRFGCLVTGNTYRYPAVLAKMAATVDHISNGRLEFGLGAAWHEGEHAAYGIPFPSVKERQDRLEEAVQLIRLLFDSDGLPVFLLRAVEIVLLFQGLAQPLVRHTDDALFVAHLIHGKAAHEILTRHDDLARVLILLADLHVLLRETLAIASYAVSRVEGFLVRRNGFLKVAQAEVVTGDVAIDIKGKDGIIDVMTL